MSKFDDGGPAFPHSYQGRDEETVISPGLSVRDYMAGQALVSRAGKFWDDFVGEHHQVAEDCYALADAMLKAREK